LFFRLGAAAGSLALIVDRTSSVKLSSTQVWAAGLMATVVPVVDLTVGSLEDRSAAGNAEFERKVNETLRIALVQIVDDSQLDWKAVGVNAFLVTRLPWKRERVLARVGQQRIASAPPPSNVKWTKGKGVIGQVWEQNTDIWVDLTSAFSAFSDYSAAEWEALPEDERFGLSFAEYTNTKQHGAVVATPIQDRSGAVIGVVSADAPDGSYDQLSIPQVREALGSAAITVRNLVG
jgi:hypothetical protein